MERRHGKQVRLIIEKKFIQAMVISILEMPLLDTLGDSYSTENHPDNINYQPRDCAGRYTRFVFDDLICVIDICSRNYYPGNPYYK